MTGAHDAVSRQGGVHLSVVVVTWNGAHLLGKCLTALQRQTFPADRYDIWVVDNASTDETAALLADSFPDVTVVRNAENRGFAGGCNDALRRIRAPYAALVNNDAVADERFLEEAFTAMESHPDAAAITGKILLEPVFTWGNENEPGLTLTDGRRVRPMTKGDDAALQASTFDVVNSTGNEIRTDGNGQDRGWLTIDGAESFSPEVFGFCGAAALLRMDAVRAAGFFEDDFFLYYEDTDLSWRLRLHGWTVRYEPRAIVRHAHAATTGEGSSLHRFYNDRNRMLMLMRCAPGWLAVRAAVKSSVGIALGLRHPKKAQSTVRLRALASVVGHLPMSVRQRRRIGKAAVVSRHDVLRLAVPSRAAMRYR